MTLYLLDGREIGKARDWAGVQDAAAWYWGVHPDDVDAIEDADGIEWLTVRGERVGTIGAPPPAITEISRAA